MEIEDLCFFGDETGYRAFCIPTQPRLPAAKFSFVVNLLYLQSVVLLPAGGEANEGLPHIKGSMTAHALP